MTFRIKSTAIAMTAFLIATNAYAQESTASQSNMTQPQSQAQPIDQQTIDQFTKAHSAVISIQQHFSEQLSRTSDQQKAQAVHMEAQEKMIEAVEESGLSVKQYSDIVAMLERDPKLRQQVFGE